MTWGRGQRKWDGGDEAGARVVAVRGGQLGHLEGSAGGGRGWSQSQLRHSGVYNQGDGGAFAERGALQEEQVCGMLSPVLHTQSLRYP